MGSEFLNNTIGKLYDMGQSIWCDNISRALITSGELQRLLDLGVVGVTSNPTIFMKAITGSADYDSRIQELLEKGCDGMDLYEGLVFPDITDAADLLRPIYDRTQGVDGYVSLEVNPKLAYDTKGTLEEARRLFAVLDRRNVFIKVPATEEGLPAIQTLISEGINVNVTLIFSIEMYLKVMNAYLTGLQRWADGGGDVTRVSSVASFFVSRVDAVVDQRLKALEENGTQVDELYGRAAVANARLAYVEYEKVFGAGGKFDGLRKLGGKIQRPLWASTSTKNPAYSTTKYVDELVGPDTVNTLPPNTIDLVLEHGTAKTTLRDELKAASDLFLQLEQRGIVIKEVTDQLSTDGVALFAASFDELLTNLAHKQTTLRTAT